jgi:hypothetical protein
MYGLDGFLELRQIGLHLSDFAARTPSNVATTPPPRNYIYFILPGAETCHIATGLGHDRSPLPGAAFFASAAVSDGLERPVKSVEQALTQTGRQRERHTPRQTDRQRERQVHRMHA